MTWGVERRGGIREERGDGDMGSREGLVTLFVYAECLEGKLLKMEHKNDL